MPLNAVPLPVPSPQDVVTMRDAVEAATSLVALRQALRMDRAGRRDPRLQAVRQRLFEQMPEDGVSYLARAVYRGSVEKVRLLLDAGAPPNLIQEGLSDHDPDMPVIDPRNRPLVLAVQHAAHSEYSADVARARSAKVVAMVDLLLDAGADVRILSHLRDGLLHTIARLPALWSDGVAVGLMQRFIGQGLDPTSVNAIGGETALHILVQQRTAPPQDIVTAMVAMGVPVLAKDRHGRTVLDRVRTTQGTSPTLITLLERLEIETEQNALRDVFEGTACAPVNARAPRARL